MRNFLFIILFILFSTILKAQTGESSHIKISLLTCSPGEDLYTSFGHTAIRIIDSAKHSDVVFNYGTFNFDQPNFYLKFARGKLNYMLDESTFSDFMYEYYEDKRGVTEQDLSLSDAEKKFVITFLQNNYLPQNREYKYDFLYDNCATRTRDILFNKLQGVHLNKEIVDSNTTFRDLIHFYLDKSGQPWSKLGIDILLGSPTDKKLNNRTSMFLPDFLSKGVGEATIHGKPYVSSSRQLLPDHAAGDVQGKYTPLILFSCICIFYLLLFYLFRKNVFVTGLLNSILLYITGLLGLLLLFMWFGTDHQTCKNNYNLLWALPTNFIAAFFIWKKREVLRKYFFIVAIVTVLLLICWLFLPQHFNIALLPFCILMMIVYGRLARK
ncbi:MAG: DUF4105 domain-containing protein [Arachidicoccus sp.]|nr:DUF4105 domain-containing protein [Arachidicoccus sp.]